jgi:SAM-dependent methyltransferase
MPESPDAAYERLTGYGFVRRFTRGKTVANICWEEIGYGSHLLSDNAESVVSLVNSDEAVDLASAIYSAPNTSYQRAGLPELPYSEDYFDVVVAFRVLEHLEHPEGLVRESKRVLKQGGTLVISVPDKQTNASSHRGVAARRGMYVPQFRELLERSFGHVRIYRQGAVAGGFVFPDSGEIGSTSVESARFSLTTPDPGVEPPTIHSVMAVCSDIDALGKQEERPYLLLDRDRWVFDECEKQAEDVELLRDEIQRMQETEVQAFLTTLRSYESRAAKAGRGLVHVRNLIYGAKRRLFGSRRQKS